MLEAMCWYGPFPPSNSTSTRCAWSAPTPKVAGLANHRACIANRDFIMRHTSVHTFASPIAAGERDQTEHARGDVCSLNRNEEHEPDIHFEVTSGEMRDVHEAGFKSWDVNHARAIFMRANAGITAVETIQPPPPGGVVLKVQARPD